MIVSIVDKRWFGLYSKDGMNGGLDGSQKVICLVIWIVDKWSRKDGLDNVQKVV